VTELVILTCYVSAVRSPCDVHLYDSCVCILYTSCMSA